MAASKKELISGVALELLNRDGYGNVTLRQIAQESGVALGTLSYYFPKMEDLVLHLLSDLHGGYEELLTGEGVGLAGLVRLFVAAQKNRDAYPFYFRDISRVIADSPRMEEETKRFERLLLDRVLSTLFELRVQGVLRPELRDSDLRALATAMVAVESSWSERCSPHVVLPGEVGELASTLSGMLALCVANDHVVELDMALELVKTELR